MTDEPKRTAATAGTITSASGNTYVHPALTKKPRPSEASLIMMISPGRRTATAGWALNPLTGLVAGPEVVILNGYKRNSQGAFFMCAQFSTHSVTSIAQDDTNLDLIYVSAGDGASYANTDYGQMGDQNVVGGIVGPCQDHISFRGAFRSMDPLRLNGKYH